MTTYYTGSTTDVESPELSTSPTLTSVVELM